MGGKRRSGVRGGGREKGGGEGVRGREGASMSFNVKRKKSLAKQIQPQGP